MTACSSRIDPSRDHRDAVRDDKHSAIAIARIMECMPRLHRRHLNEAIAALKDERDRRDREAMPIGRIHMSMASPPTGPQATANTPPSPEGPR
jgi:hypothetical protein